MAVIHRNMINSEHGGNLIDNRVSARLNTVIIPNRLEIVGVNSLMIQERFSPAAVEIDAFGLDLEIGQVIIFYQMGFGDPLDFIHNGLRQDFLDQAKLVILLDHQDFLAVQRHFELHG